MPVIAVVAFCCSCDDSDKVTPETDEKPDNTDTAFVKGADISWVTEMEDDGVKFYDSKGEEKDCFLLMKEVGMNAIRLRVWVNPENGYGDYCNQKDVVAKAVRARNAGMDVMVDFHYSDFFADPGRQTMPAAWAGKPMAELRSAVADHTKSLLNALKTSGVAPT